MRVLTIVGGNLFEIASAELGNALQWINIARANDLEDPVLIGQNRILLPTISPVFSDGIGCQ